MLTARRDAWRLLRERLPWRRSAVVFTAAAALGPGGMGCQDNLVRQPRPAREITISGVVTPTQIQLSPARVGAGPIEIVLSNQTDRAIRLTLEGRDVKDLVTPVQPFDTATIAKDLARGRYTLQASYSSRGSDAIATARLQVSEQRPSSNAELLLP